MSRTPSWFRTILPSPGHAAVGATVAGTVLTGLAAAPSEWAGSSAAASRWWP